MSMYGDSNYSNEKNDIYDEMKWFLENHPVSELLQIVADVVENEIEPYREDGETDEVN